MTVIILIFSGGGGGMLLLLIACLVVAAVIGSGALAGIIAALTTLLIVMAIIAGVALVTAGLIWFLTRGIRAQKREDARLAREQQIREYEEKRERRRIERQQQLAITQAQSMAPFAAIIAEALRANQTQDDRRVHQTPYYYHAEVLDGRDE